MSDQREYPLSPIAGVGAVVLHTGCVLLVRRANAPLAGEWSLPGGAVELGETLEEAIIREVTEETGLTVAPIKLLKAFDHVDRDPDGRIRFHYVLVDFLCSVQSAEQHAADGALRAASDVSDARWVQIEGLRASKDFPLAERTLDVIDAGWAEVQKSGLAARFRR